ncbi:hypothetical protein GCK72_023487 [Caenorhabditis remanei]|uniref:Uncharacterized protein n=1 Tax=Caenorhabditis remanei TaxID=31234 RepID=A0A6A5FXB1_CAERE|nr:hypothetical protein GCK72_023487 [Caenorhabditis remanei]KAF1747029.1 hypothetical protein GCK72_023487 [Caenorhabditis remanei]
MTDEFVVDITVFPHPPELLMQLTLKDHKIKFEGRTIKMLKASSSETVLEYDCSILLYKPMKHPGQRERMVLSIQFASTPGMKLVFNNSNRNYVGYVIEKFNAFLEANKAHVHQKRVTIENVPTVDPHQIITSSVPIKKRRAEWEFQIGREGNSTQKLIRLDNAINYTQQSEQVEDLNPFNEVVSNGKDNIPVEQNETVTVKGQIITDGNEAFSANQRIEKGEVKDVRNVKEERVTQEAMNSN